MVAALSVAVVGCGSAADATACGQVEFGGTGDPDLVLVSDLPLQGSAARASRQINDAIRMELRGAQGQTWSAHDRLPGV